MKISVLESGGWGTALASSLARKGHAVTLHSIYEKASDTLRRTRENKYLKGVILPDALEFSDDLEAVRSAEAVVFVPPSYAIRTVCEAVKDYVPKDAVVISASKGIESGSNLRLSEIISAYIGSPERIVALSGPSHAEEVGRGIPTGCVAACTNGEAARRVQDIFMSPELRIYTSSDIVGVELCGTLKNVIAICAGMCYGMGYGDNTLALLMTRGLSEMAALGVALGGRKETFAGLAGMGDLIVTCTSQHSRNRRAGSYIGSGIPVEEALKKVGATVEGDYAAKAAKELSLKAGAEMPIIEETYKILYEGKNPRIVGTELMARSPKSEINEDWVM